MREIRLLRGRLQRKGGGLTGMGRPHISKMLIAKTKIYVYFYFCLLECISPPSYMAPPTKGHPSYLARFQMH